MQLNVIVSCIDEGIKRVDLITNDRFPNVKYIISHQYTEKTYLKTPGSLIRSDIVVSKLSGKGLSRNRNNAIKHATGDIAVIADDDVTYLPDSFQNILAVFKNDPELDVACFKIKTPDGKPEFKNYPTRPFVLNKNRHHYISSIEIAFKVSSIKKHDIWFDERFGIGSGLFYAGEEEIFINDCIKSRLKVMYHPFYTVTHPFETSTTGVSIFSPKRNKLRGAINARTHGWKAIPKAFYDTAINFFKIITNKRNPLFYLTERLQAIFTIYRTKSIEPNNKQ